MTADLPDSPAPDSPDPLAVTREFVDAIVWGEHRTVWELLAPSGRRAVLRVAVDRGMDEALSARLRDGTATRGEREDFLTDLVNGLRADLRGNDLDALECHLDPDADAPSSDSARVLLVAPMIDPVALGEPLPVASVDLSRHEDRWRVEELRPRAHR